MTKRFYTLAEYNNINAAKLKPFEDQWGRDIIYAALQNCSASPIKEFQQNATLSASKGNCYYDLLMTLENGEKYVIEVKYRGNDFDSKSFPTHLINVEKFQSFYKALVNKEITNGLVCSIWSDGVIWFSHMGKYSSIE